jgi:SAM-dependent methyltransferase
MDKKQEPSAQLITSSKVHAKTLDQIVEEIKLRLQQTPEDKLVLPLSTELDILSQLTEFEFGRYLLENKGLNGFWTSFVIHDGKLPGVNEEKEKTELEDFLLKNTYLSTQRRFKIFKKEIQTRLKDGMTLTSIPCGLMDDLLSLDYKNLKNIKLVGIDLDRESLKLAHKNSQEVYKLSDEIKLEFREKNAFTLDIHEEFDLITSNGLNAYVNDDEKIVALYQQFYNALKTGGVLITSFVTPTPLVDKESTWKDYKMETLVKMTAIEHDIVQTLYYPAFRKEHHMKNLLERAGFSDISFIHEPQHIFPTVIAKKKNI